MSEFKPCGCLTDGYNWLKECDEHTKLRRRTRSEIALTPERAQRIASFLWSYNGPNQELAWQFSNDLTAALETAAPQPAGTTPSPASVGENSGADAAAPRAHSKSEYKRLQAQGADVSPPSATKETEEERQARADGEAAAHEVFGNFGELLRAEKEKRTPPSLACTANPERRPSLEQSEVKPDGSNDRQAGEESGRGQDRARSDAVRASGLKRGARSAGQEADASLSRGGGAACVPSPAPCTALVEACQGLISYWTRNLRNFQWEKADTHIKRINIALGDLSSTSPAEPEKS